MVTQTDWLPRNHKALYNQGKMAFGYLSDENNRKRIGIEGATTGWILSTLVPRWQAYDTAYTAWVNPSTRTEQHNVSLRIAQDELEVPCRRLYELLKANPAVTDADLQAMGLPVRDTMNKL